MTTSVSVPTTGRDWRVIGFRVAAGLAGLLILLVGLHGMVSPWVGQIWVQPESPEIVDPLSHLWHDGQFGAFILAALSSLALAAVRPRGETLRMQLYVAAVVIFLLAIAPFNPAAVPFLVVLFGLPILAYPELRQLLRGDDGRMSPALLAATALTAVLLTPSAWGWMQAQLAMGDDHAHYQHWVTGVAVSLIIVAAQVLASTRRRGWRVAAGVAGLMLAYLGAAAIAQARNPGSWGLLGGTAAIVGAGIWLGLAWFVGRTPEGS